MNRTNKITDEHQAVRFTVINGDRRQYSEPEEDAADTEAQEMAARRTTDMEIETRHIDALSSGKALLRTHWESIGMKATQVAAVLKEMVDS